MVFIVILVVSLALQHLFPWWIVPVVAYLASLFLAKSAGKAFVSGFLSIFLLWTALSFWVWAGNDGQLANRIGVMLGGVPGVVLPVVTGIIGGLASGLAAWAGWFGGRIFRREL
jgi:hypothetical protein